MWIGISVGLLLFNGFLIWRYFTLFRQNQRLMLDKVILEERGRQSELGQRQMQIEFESLNRRFFDESSERLHKLSKESFQTLVAPFDAELKNLQTRIHEVYDRESRERLSLKKDLEYMMKMNEKMSLEAQSLTKALRGDVKAQGTWGEVVLERILESSGLREGHEYVVQGRGLGLKSDDGASLKPDVLVYLPGERNLIVDSKVSLNAYEAYIRAEEDTEKSQHLKSFLQSLRKHVDGLSEKSYQNLYGVQSPDFVLMFMPTDGAFSLAHQMDPELFHYAMNKKVGIVCPSLLYPNLRTIETLWRQERQSKNAEEIARQAGNLYDKFVSFIEDLDLISSHLKRAEEAHSAAVSKLKLGKGNLVDRVERLKDLGAKAKKQLPRSEDINPF